MEGRERDVKRERVGAPLALSNPNMKNLFRQSDSAFPDFPFFWSFSTLSSLFSPNSFGFDFIPAAQRFGIFLCIQDIDFSCRIRST